MSLLRRIIDAWHPESSPPEPDAFGITPDGQARLAELPRGWGVIIACSGELGDTLELEVREAKTSDRVTFTGFPPDRLRGLLLDFDRPVSQWRFLTNLEVRVRETPNPRCRLYTVNRIVAAGGTGFFTRGTENPILIERLFVAPELTSIFVRQHTATVECVEENVEWSTVHEHVSRVLRRYFLDAGVAVLVQESPHYVDEFEQAIAQALAKEVLPTVRRDGGDLRLVDARDGVVRVHMSGACRGCPSSETTLHRAVLGLLERRFPGKIKHIEAI